jgi:PrtD family type I secretion system ABC transporter
MKSLDAIAQIRAELRRPLVAVGTFGLVINLLSLTVPIYMSQVYDRVLTSYSIETLVMLTVMAIALLALLAALDGVRHRLLMQAALKAEQALGPALLAASVKDQLAGRTDATQALRDLTALRGFATSPVVSSFFDAPLVPFYVLVVFLIHWSLGLAALCGALAMLGFTVLNQALTKRRAEKANKGTNALLHSADQQSRNADVIEAMGLMPDLARRWRVDHDGVLSDQFAAYDRSAHFQTLSRFVRLALQVLVLALGAALVLDREITPGMMFAASIILARGLQPVEAAIGSWRAALAAKGQYGRIRDALDRNRVEREPMQLPEPQGQLDVETVVFIAGAERKPILRGLSFSLAAGEVLGVIGPTASGKSTLARLILGVWTASSGKIRLDGTDISQWDRPALGRHVGYLPQEVELFPATIAQNIARMSEIDPEAVVAAAQMAGVHDMILRMPRGYDTPIMAGGLMISPGQRQRIALARAFYGSPKLVVLDEPNANLDGEGEGALGEALRLAKQQAVTVIVITHRLGVLRHTDKILALREGAIQGYGPRDDVLARFARRPTNGQVAPVAPVRTVAPQ